MKMKAFCAICYSFLITLIRTEPSNNLNNVTEQSDTQTSTRWLSNESNSPLMALSLNETDAPSMQQGEIWLREMCQTNGDSDSYRSAQAALKAVWKCFDDIIEFSKLPKRIEEARPTGSLDEVFGPYCRRAVDMKGCVRTFLADIDPCLSVDQNASKLTILNITEALFGFACAKDGVHIALFIAEKGPKCIADKQSGIERCIRNGLNESDTMLNQSNYNATTENANELSATSRVNGEPGKSFSFSFKREQCRIAYKTRNCILAELLDCNDKTPANVVEALFNMVQKKTTCSKYSRSELDPSYAVANAALEDNVNSPVLTLVIPVMTLLVVGQIILA